MDQRWSIIACLTLAVSCYSVQAQDYEYPVLNLSADEVAAPQNWAITEFRDHLVFGNNAGVLLYDGHEFDLYPIENGSIIRSVRQHDDTLWVGGVGEFGKMYADEHGFINYQNLTTELSDTLQQRFTDVWSIWSDDDYVYFITLTHLMVWDGADLSTQSIELFSLPNITSTGVFFQTRRHGLTTLKNGDLAPVEIDGLDEQIIQIGANRDNEMLLFTGQGNIYKASYADSLITDITLADQANWYRKKLTGKESFSPYSTSSSEEFVILNTLNQGAFVVGMNGELLHVFDESNGLQNQAIINSKMIDNQLILALENGISLISWPVTTKFWSSNSDLGLRQEAILVSGNKVYVGGIGGLFSIDRRTFKTEKITGDHQIWDLIEQDGIIYAASATGLLSVDTNNRVRQLWDEYLIRKLVYDADRKGFWIGSAGMVGFIEKKNNEWKLTHRIDKKMTRGAITHIELDSNGDLWFTDELEAISYMSSDSIEAGAKGPVNFDSKDHVALNSKISLSSSPDGQIYIENENGVFEIDAELNIEQPDWELSDKVMKSLSFFESDTLARNGDYNQLLPPVFSVNKPIDSRWYNLPSQRYIDYDFSNEELWIAGFEGVAYMDMSISYPVPKPSARLTKVIIDGDSVLLGGFQLPDKSFTLAPHQKDVVFSAGSVQPYSDDRVYQFKLTGYDREWSSWDSSPTKVYTNLDDGDYTFQVRAKNRFQQVSEIYSTDIEIHPNWYETTWAILMWSILGVGVLTMAMQRIVRIREEQARLEAEEAMERQREKAQLKEAELRAKAAEAETRAQEAEHRRKTEELERARNIQQQFLPDTFPESDWYSAVGFQETASEVGGDYYDLIELSEGRILVVVGDATGHGVGAGLVVAATKASVLSLDQLVPSAMMDKMNTVIKTINKSRRANMALVMAQIERVENGAHAVLSGGAMPPVLCLRSDGELEEISLEGLPLGIMKQPSYDTRELDLNKNDMLIFVSDGLPERQNPDEEWLGYNRFYKSVERYAEEVSPDDWNADDLVKRLSELGESWADGVIKDDDVTIFVLKV